LPDIHPTAVVSPEADLAPNVKVGPHAVIETGVKVGEGTVIGAGACLLRGTRLGRANEVHAYAVLGDTPQDFGFEGGETFLEIGDRNVIREFVTVHRGTKPGTTTRIACDCMLMACSHVAHNCALADRVVLTNGALLGGYVEVGEKAFVSGNAVVHQFTRVGRVAMIAGNARATMDVPPFTTVSGSNCLSGINRIGIRRAGLASGAIAEIGRAYRRLFLSELAPDDAAREIVASASRPEAKEMAEFVLATKRGVCRAARRRRVGAGAGALRPSPGGGDEGTGQA
jgi:UDP-N-acetylglucosamine acyltransferase